MPIKRGTLVIEYTGPRLTNEEAEEHERRSNRYLFEVNSRCTVDGSPRSNTARYANHSCRPNMEPDIIKGRIMLRAIKHIWPGEEMTYDYGKDYLNNYIPVCKCAKCRERRHGGARKKNGKNGHAGTGNGKNGNGKSRR
jgi:SET domain-containing protein